MEKNETTENSKTSSRKSKNELIEGSISPDFISESIRRHNVKKNIGAHSIFLGQVRNDLINGREVKAIQYSAYLEMAQEKLMEIREDTFDRYPLICAHIHHSIGHVEAGEISLFVFTSSKHRMDAQNACSEIVERVKKEVPVWGREVFGDNQFSWKKEN